MELIIVIILAFIIVFVFLSSSNIDHFGDKLAENIKTNVVSAFTGIGDKIVRLFKVGFDPVIPDKIPCPNGMRDDGTSCWRDTLPNGVGTIPRLNDCPRGSKDIAGTCWLDSSCRTTGGDCTGGGCRTVDNGYHNSSWGCDWGFQNCRNDYYKTWIAKLETKCEPIRCNPVVTTGCPYVTRNIGDRGSSCGNNQSNVAGLCYNNCPSGYRFAGGNLCEPNEGPGIKVTAFQRYKCPPAWKPTHTKLTGALCYAEL
jgi:hypothetical protein